MSAAIVVEQRRLKYAATINDESLTDATHPDFDLQYIDIGNVDCYGHIHDVVTHRFHDAPSRARRIAREGDVIISTVRTYLQAIAPIENPPENLIVSTGFAVVRPNKLLLHPRFCKYALRAKRFLWEVESRSTGVSYPAIKASDLADIPVSLPSVRTQALIADYLDRETGRIDALVAEKQKMLALLEEKRAALISRAVTRGLDPHIRLKPSGLDWLEDIPAYWEVCRLKFLVRRIEQGSSPQCYNHPAEAGQWGVLKAGCVNSGVFREFENKALPSDIDPFIHDEVQANDILMSRASGSVDLIGSVACVPTKPTARLLLSDKIYRLELRGEIALPSFFAYAMGADYVRHQIRSVISGAEGLANNIAKSDILEFPIVTPPIDEQYDIASKLAARLAKHNSLSDLLTESVKKLRERRAALITAAVTGQIPMAQMQS
jgi:type I restriction enzyme S subunit